MPLGSPLARPRPRLILDRKRRHPMRTAVVFGTSLALFLAAAKAHGRELRLERVAQGIESVVFGGTNPAFVEELWRAERLRFWIAAPIAAAVIGAFLRSRGHAWGPTVFGAVAWGAALTFTTL